MNYAGKIEIIRKHTIMITKKICVLLCFQSFVSTFFSQRLFLFKALSKIFKDFCGKFKAFSRISHNFSILKDLSRTLCFFKDFPRPVRTMFLVKKRVQWSFPLYLFLKKTPQNFQLNLVRVVTPDL